jgi:hypothetical protein
MIGVGYSLWFWVGFCIFLSLPGILLGGAVGFSILKVAKSLVCWLDAKTDEQRIATQLGSQRGSPMRLDERGFMANERRFMPSDK